MEYLKHQKLKHLTEEQVSSFMTNGFLKISKAFTPEAACLLEPRRLDQAGRRSKRQVDMEGRKDEHAFSPMDPRQGHLASRLECHL